MQAKQAVLKKQKFIFQMAVTHNLAARASALHTRGDRAEEKED